jgi:hypothetical protein
MTLVNLAATSPILQASGIGIYVGSGAPTFTASQGSLYINTTASTTTTRFYINTNGGTTWAYFTASA